MTRIDRRSLSLLGLATMLSPRSAFAADYPSRPIHLIVGFTPRPTLGELQQATPWVWLWCECCQHHAPLACAVAVLLWGPDASSDKLRAGARCTSCGSKGGTVQHPGWAGNHIGFQPFPTSGHAL